MTQTTVTPEQFTICLEKAPDWVKIGSCRGANVWEHSAGERIIVPPKADFPDDEDLVRAAIHKLSQIMNVSREEVIREIAGLGASLDWDMTGWDDGPTGVTAIGIIDALKGCGDAELEDPVRVVTPGGRTLKLRGVTARDGEVHIVVEP